VQQTNLSNHGSDKLNKESTVQVSDTTMFNSSTTAGYKKTH